MRLVVLNKLNGEAVLVNPEHVTAVFGAPGGGTAVATNDSVDGEYWIVEGTLEAVARRLQYDE
jgi:uncharacterized protein YlzI (FlbEa/FlbD family)